MGSLSGEPAPEALRMGKSAEVGKTVRGFRRMRRTAYCAELFEDASLVGLYRSVRSSYCAISLAVACCI